MADKIVRNIMICPLNWGLGHATRMIPVIEMLQEKGMNVIIGAYGSSEILLRKRFPQIGIIDLPGFEPRYPAKGSMGLKLVFSLPRFTINFFKAREIFRKLIDEKSIDIVISDNRYELYSSKDVYSVFVTHQLNIKTYGLQKLAKPIINMVVNFFVKRFDEIWIPDDPNVLLSGSLSRKKNKKVRFIGLLSRFTKSGNHQEKEFDVVAIISGPEPQRTIFENIVWQQMEASGLICAIISGKPDCQEIITKNNVTVYPHLEDLQFAKLIESARLIISRPGYSTLMDLTNFDTKVVFVPTPGQTEQVYLADKLLNEGVAFSMHQKNFNLDKAIKESVKYKSLRVLNDSALLSEAIDYVLYGRV